MYVAMRYTHSPCCRRLWLRLKAPNRGGMEENQRDVQLCCRSSNSAAAAPRHHHAQPRREGRSTGNSQVTECTVSDRETASYVVGHVYAATWLSNHNSMLRSLCTEFTGERRLWVTGQRHGTGMCAAFSPLVSALGVASSSQVAEGRYIGWPQHCLSYQ